MTGVGNRDMKLLLDTNIIISHTNGRETISEMTEHDFSVSVATLFELLRLSGMSRVEETTVREFLNNCELLAVTEQIAARAAYMCRTRNTGPLDLLIAATALEYDLPLVTKNVKDFRDIKGLTVLESIES